MEAELAVSLSGAARPPAGRIPLLEQVLEELAYGVAVASPAGELLHANQAARQELARGRALQEQQGRLRTHAPGDAKVLQEAIARACAGKRSLVHLQAREGHPLGVAVVPVRRARPSDPVQAALLFSRSSVCESLMLCFFARSHSLTPTEEHVLAILCQGFSAPQVARQMKVAVSTVRSHVRSLCAKTRCNGVRELVRRVAMLPPLAPALLYDGAH